MKPRIFVGSTILDFEDLRSALKYYFEERGYEVQMSEFPNFNVDRDSDTFDACIKNLEKCQYYILLIGYRRGSWFKEGEISITHKEYLAVKTLIENGHPLRIISFVRKPIWLLKNDREALINHFKSKSTEIAEEISKLGSTVIDDPEYIFNFINEVSNGIKLPNSDSPVNNWIFDFESFEDIITALKNTFNISESLENKKLKRLLINELKENYERFFIKTFDSENNTNYADKVPENYLDYFRKRFFNMLFDEKGNYKTKIDEVTIEGKELTQIFMNTYYYQNLKGLRLIKSTILKRVLDEGLFLEYDITKDDFKTNLITVALEKLLDSIISIATYHDSDLEKKFNDEMSRLMTDGSAHSSSLRLSISVVGSIIIQGNFARIPELIQAILNYLEKNDYADLIHFNFSPFYYTKPKV